MKYLEFSIDMETLRKRIKIFWMTFILVFFFVMLQYLGIKAPKILRSEAVQQNTIDVLLPKLQQQTNTFTLRKHPQTTDAAIIETVSAYAVVDIDTGEMLASKNPDTILPIASLTKIMTATVALDLASPEEKFVLSAKAAAQIPTKIGVIPDQSLTVNELLHALLLTSANDSAKVLEEGINKKYGDDVFVAAMNKKAEILGLQNTHFANVQGFDHPENYSTARELSILTGYVLNNYPAITAISQKDYYFLPESSDHKQFDLYNWNGLIGVYPDVFGLKIGSTERAGKTTIVVSRRNGKRIAAVLLGAPTVIERDLYAAKLLDVGYTISLGLQAINVTKENLEAKYATWKFWPE